MQGFDYVGKRVLFAAVTVFVAITLNFVLFRTLSGDAVSRAALPVPDVQGVPAGAARARPVQVGAIQALPRGHRAREHGEVPALGAAGHP